ncbi:MAG TPA: hypothetical protein VGC97_06785 [Pyrinomonadaceae bacterium]|jgi:hypothetical protein
MIYLLRFNIVKKYKKQLLKSLIIANILNVASLELIKSSRIATQPNQLRSSAVDFRVLPFSKNTENLRRLSGKNISIGKRFAACGQGGALVFLPNSKSQKFGQKLIYECNQTAGASPKDDTKPADKGWQMDGKS